jgi:hypothetical protein
MVLKKPLEHLKDEIELRNFRVYWLPDNLSKDDWRGLVADRAIVTDDPEEYLPELSELCCRVIDISRISELPAPELADYIYFAWVDLKLRDQASCHVILRKKENPRLFYARGVNRVEE